MKSTLEVCPLSSAIFTIDGYFHSVNWLSGNPWELTSSRSFLLHSRAETWDPVSTEFKHAPVWIFQNLMHRSLMPPPEASILLWKGHQARALTAALWSWILCSHWVLEFKPAIDRSQMCSKLSLPPLARYRPEGDHLIPQTSSRCPL